MGLFDALPEMPNHPVLEYHGQKRRFILPCNLKPLLEELIVETLRNDPENLYQFYADLLEKKLEEREQGAYVDQAPEESQEEKEVKAAIVIQKNIRGLLVRKEYTKSTLTVIKRPEVVDTAPRLEQEIDEEATKPSAKEFEDREVKAAITIQKNIRGFIARKEYEMKSEPNLKRMHGTNLNKKAATLKHEDKKTSSKQDTEEKAAIVIQKNIRGLLARKEYAKSQATLKNSTGIPSTSSKEGHKKKPIDKDTNIIITSNSSSSGTSAAGGRLAKSTDFVNVHKPRGRLSKPSKTTLPQFDR